MCEQSWRVRTERLVYVPLLRWRTSLRELCLLLATATLTGFWVAYYWTQVRVALSPAPLQPLAFLGPVCLARGPVVR